MTPGVQTPGLQSEVQHPWSNGMGFAAELGKGTGSVFSFYFLSHIYPTYRDVPKFRQVWVNGVDPPRGAVWSGSTLFAIPSACLGCITLWYYSMVKPPCLNFRAIYYCNFLGVLIVRNFTVYLGRWLDMTALLLTGPLNLDSIKLTYLAGRNTKLKYFIACPITGKFSSSEDKSFIIQNESQWHTLLH